MGIKNHYDVIEGVKTLPKVNDVITIYHYFRDKSKDRVDTHMWVKNVDERENYAMITYVPEPGYENGWYGFGVCRVESENKEYASRIEITGHRGAEKRVLL